MTVDLNTVTLEDFSKYLNTEFTMYPGGRDPVKLKLIEILDKSNDQIDGFSLAFLGKFDTVFSQKIYRFTHDNMEEISMFVVPFNKDEKGVYYEAIFSRLKNKS